MNNEELKSPIGVSDLKITPESMAYLHSVAKWAKFLAIVGFVVVGLVAIIAIFTGLYLSSMSSEYGIYSPVSATMVTIIYLIVAVIYFFPVLFGYRFAVNLQSAIARKETQILTESFKNLNRYCLFIGIMTIIAIALFVIAIISVIISGIIASSM